MRKTLAAAVALQLSLTGCSCLQACLTGAPAFEPKNPKVYVIASKDPGHKAVVVDQDPIYFFREYGPKIQIRWQLQTKGYRFDTKLGIAEIKTVSGASGQVHSCRVDPDSKDQATFVCTNENTASAVYKYTINVVATDGSANPRPLDPTIMND